MATSSKWKDPATRGEQQENNKQGGPLGPYQFTSIQLQRAACRKKEE